MTQSPVFRISFAFPAANPRFSLRSAFIKALSLSIFLALFTCLLTPAMAHAGTLTVDTTADSTDSPNDCATGAGSACSLRDAISQANADNNGDFIQFSVTGTITLTSSLPTITANVTIFGPGANSLSISGNNVDSIFSISGNHSISIQRLSMINGLGYPNAGNTYGGAIYSSGPFGDLTVSQCAFSGNNANYGGAIYNVSATLTLSDSTFTANSANNGGAVYTQTSGASGLTNNTFSGNQASGNGGAVSNTNWLIATNNTFSNNSAGLGAAIYNANTSIVLTAGNNIFSGNTSSSAGAGIYGGGTGNASYNVYYNNFTNGSEDDCNTCSTNANATSASANPIALPLANYGGMTATFLLQPGSAAICAGSASLATIATDQRGFVLDPSCVSGSVDAGAVQTNQYTVNTLADSSDGSCTTTCSLRDAISAANTTPGDITFASSLTLPGTINIGAPGGGNGSTLSFNGQTNILGPGPARLTINGDSDTNVGSVLTFSSGAQVFIDGLTISGGYNSTGNGGGINNQGSLTLFSTAVSDNNVANGASGGGIYSSGSLTLTDSTISGNSSIYGSGSGGGISSAGTLTITESTVEGNSISFQSTGGGGGIFVSGGTATLTASTVSGNSAAQLCPGGPTCMGGSGGGIFNSGTLTMFNTILAGNTAGTDNDAVGALQAASANNLLGDPTGTSGITNGANGNLVGVSGTPLSPMISGPQGNGIGATVSTMILLPGSPAICAGSLANIPSGITTDERGYPLVPAGGYCPSGSVDIGAVQTNYTSAAFVRQPANTLVNTAISPDPAVAVYETDTLLSSNNTDAVSGVPITLSYSDSANITGTLTETSAGGIADFGGLTPTAPESAASFSYSIPVYGSTTFAATSNTFSVIGPAAQFALSMPTYATAGSPFQFAVTAEDSAGNTITGYSGTVAFSTSDTAAGVILPANATLTNGTGTFNATLITEGYKSITATDTVTSSITGTAYVTVSATSALNLQAIGYPSTWYAGATAQVFVEAVDQYGNVVQNFVGPVTVTASDSAATVTQFTSFSYGVASYSVIFNTQGPQSITVSSTSLPSGTESGIQIGPMPQFLVTVSSDATDGQDTASDCTNQSQPGATPDAACSLRDALWAAGYLGAGNVTFSSSAFNAATIITLTAPQNSGSDFGAIPLGANVTVTGPTQGTGPSATNLVTISGAVPASPATGSAIFFAYGTPYGGGLIAPDAIANLNIVNGNGTAATGDDSGTGGVSTEATLTVTNCNFTGNTGDYAGAIYNYSGALTVNGGTFSGNSSTGLYGSDAGAIFSDTATGTPKFIKDHPFALGKSAALGVNALASSSAHAAQSGYFGPALGGRSGFASRIRPMGGNKPGPNTGSPASTLGSLKLSIAPHLSAPVSPEAPPPPSYSGPSATITNATFSNNGGYYAGAFYDLEDVVSISGATFTNNTALFGAGALIVDQQGSTAVSNSSFSGNSGGFTGGALVVADSELQMEDSTFSGNTSYGFSGAPIIDGGALIALDDSFALLAYDTFYNNSSTSSQGAGAISDLGSDGGFVAAFNVTATGNSGYFGAMIDDTGSENDIENTLASGNTSTDPTYLTDGISPDVNGINPVVGDVFSNPAVNLAPLGNYGGATQTAIPLPGSTAICSGSVVGLSDAASNWGLSLTTDQRGNPNLNTTYPGTGGVCVDAGSVQTNYAIAFTAQPPASGTIGEALNPAPVVSLTESTIPFAANSGTVTIADTANLLTGTLSETFASGAATFNNLVFPSPTTGDILHATLPLTSSITLTAQATTGITVPRTSQTITFANPGTQIVGTPLTLSASADSGLGVTFSSITGSRCTVSGNTATFIASGTCTIVAEQKGNSNYFPAPQVSQSFTVANETQTITFANPGTQSVGAPLTLSATATSGLAVTFSSLTGSKCTVSGNKATFLASGTCIIVAEQAGNGAYTAAPQVSQSFTVNKESQTITFTNPGTQTIGTPLTLSATASSGLTVTYSSLTGSKCTVSGNTATFIVSGTCVIDATQTGNGSYSPATLVSQSFTVNKEPQTITFANPGAQAIGTPLTLSASATSGLAVTYSSITGSKCTVSGNTVTFIATGTCVIVAGQAGNNAYAAAPGVSQNITVNKEAQTITFANPGTQTVGTPLTLSASASSGLGVTYSSITGSRCTVSGNTATFIESGTCVIVAAQSGNNTFAAAPQVSQSFTVKSH